MNNLHRLLVLLFMIMVPTAAIQAQAYNESKDFSYALKLYDENFYDVAAQQFSSFITRYPDSDRIAEAHFYHGNSLFNIEDFEQARIVFQNLAVTFPDNQRAADAWRRVGESYEELNKAADAAKAFETVKILYPNHSLAASSLLDAARLFHQQEQLEKADQVIRDFLDRYLESSEYPRGRLLYGEILLDKGNLEQADIEFQKTLEISDAPLVRAAATLGRAQVYLRLGLFEEASANMQSVITNNRGSNPAFESLQILLESLLQRQDWNAALTLLQNESRHYSGARLQALNLLGAQALFRAGNYASTIDMANRILADKPAKEIKTRATYYRASATAKQEARTDARDDFKALVEMQDQTGSLYSRASLFSLANYCPGAG